MSSETGGRRHRFLLVYPVGGRYNWHGLCEGSLSVLQELLELFRQSVHVAQEVRGVVARFLLLICLGRRDRRGQLEAQPFTYLLAAVVLDTQVRDRVL